MNLICAKCDITTYSIVVTDVNSRVATQCNLIRCLQADMTVDEFGTCCTQGAAILDNAGCQLPNRLRTENN